MKKSFSIFTLAVTLCCVCTLFFPVFAAEIPSDLDSQIAALTDNIASHSNESVLYYRRGNLYLKKQEFSLAVDDLNKAIEINPKYAVAYSDRGFAYSKLNQPDLAISNYSKAIELDPSYELPYTNRAFIYIQKAEYNLAISDCDKVISLNPKFAKAYFLKGTALEKNLMFTEAIETYRKVIDNCKAQQADINTAKVRIRNLGGTI